MPSSRDKPLLPFRASLPKELGAPAFATHAARHAYADLLELWYLAEDVLLQRDTHKRRRQSGFAQLSLFAQNGTDPYSKAFKEWQCRYEGSDCDWKVASARTFGIVRVPTATDFAREDAEVAAPTQAPPEHPFFTCPHACFAARNIWVLPGAPEWWHQALWQMGRLSWDEQGFEDPADITQGDLRWRLFRAAGELHDKAGCSLELVPPPSTEPPPDFANRDIFLNRYLRIPGKLPLDTFARCHFAQELYRMRWSWEPRCSYEEAGDEEVDSDDDPYEVSRLFGNWKTPDGNTFFCEWRDDCPPCRDSIRGPCLPGGGFWHEEEDDGFGLGYCYPDADDFVHY